MRVLYDYQAFVAQQIGGVSRYFTELLREWQHGRLVVARAIVPFGVNRLLDAARPGLADVVRGCRAPRRSTPGPALSAVNRVLFAAATAGRSWDIYHPTYYNRLWPRPRARRMVVTVFDMIHERFPESFAPNDPTAARKRRLVQAADGVLCISEQTRLDLLAHVGALPGRVAVTPLATRIGAVTPVAFHHPRPFWLFVGAREGYKDFAALCDAVAGASGLAGTDIVCFGGGQAAAEETAALEARGLTRRVCFVSGADGLLRGAYEAALALVCPSRYEGFGLPPLEAMTLGCPVVAARASSLPEVIGEAGAWVPPGDSQALANTLLALVGEPAARATLAERGRAQAARFSWANCAAATYDFYRDVLAC